MIYLAVMLGLTLTVWILGLVVVPLLTRHYESSSPRKDPPKRIW